MISSALLRKIASILLVVCVALPLSECSTKRAEPVVGDLPARPQMGVPLPTDQSGVVTFYGYEVLAADAVAIRKGKLDSIISFAIYLLAFFGPLATLWLREPLRSGAQFCLAFPSLYALGFMTFFATPLYGGVIAVACWIVLLVLSSATLRVSFRDRKSRARQT